MPTFSAFPASDGYLSSGGTFNTAGSAFVAGGSSTRYNAFFRWTNVTVPADAVVSAATMTAVKTTGSGTCDIRIALEAADDPAFPTSKADAEGRTVTSAYAHLNTAPGNGLYTSPDMSATCQEVFDRGGWGSGQAIQCHWRDASSAGTFQAYTIERTGTADDPSISITYSVPTVYTDTGSGGVSLGGSADALLAAALTATGGVALSGTAAAAQATSDVAQGGVVLGGSAAISTVVSEIATGGVMLAGDAPNVATFAHVAQGGAVLGGSAGLSGAAVEIGSGGVVLGGSAVASVTLAELAAGGVIVGGEASVSVYSPSAGAGGSFICDACHVFRPGSQAWHLFAGGAVVVGQFVPGERAHQVGGCQCTT